MEEIYNIDATEKLWLTRGDRFEGWHFLKTFEEKKELPLGCNDLSYNFSVYDFNYRFIMPEVLGCGSGSIIYPDANRLLGVFRFPRDDEGKFIVPKKIIIPTKTDENKTSQLLMDEHFNLLNLKLSPPLVFEAFRIPQFGFKFIDITDDDVREISKIIDKIFVLDIKSNHSNILEKKIAEVMGKIEKLPNYLLILKTMLNENTNDLKEISRITNNIIRE